MVIKTMALGLATAALTAGVAGAAPSQPASVKFSLQAAPDVVSVTVSPSSGVFGNCQGGDSLDPAHLGFPNGTCDSDQVTVTSTGLRGTMLINGAAMTPVGGGTPWALCGSTDGVAPACKNGAHVPGAEQYGLQPLTILSRRALWLSNQPTCDSGFSQGPGPGGGSCVALPGDSATETVHLVGPASTADSASSYSTTVTWTVVG